MSSLSSDRSFTELQILPIHGNSMTQPAIAVIHSIPDGAALITTVLCDYPIPKPHSCKLYKRGLNDTYLVTTEREN